MLIKKFSIPAFLIYFLISSYAYGQADKIKGGISTKDTADLTILNIYPDSFPNVSVIFKAQTRKGEPIWNLSAEKMNAVENSQNCSVISLEQISKYKPINLGIVIDHSGSMANDRSLLFDKNGNPLYTFDAAGNFSLPKGYKSPIDNAKESVKSFIKSFNAEKDYISVIGFSSTVDTKLALSRDISKVNSIVDSMKADFSTALYDAMIIGIDEIKKGKGVNVLVVLTDGQDNSSKSKWGDVVTKANKENIPIYIIGLVDANIDTLRMIANSTKGDFYYTKSSSSLNKVYALISKQVQAFYNLVYVSPNLASADTARQIELSFKVDSIFLVSSPSSVKIPEEVVSYLSKKEKEKTYLIEGGIALATIIVAGTLLFYFKRKSSTKRQPVIKKLYPNPSAGMINLEFVSSAGQLQIVNLTGQMVKSLLINGSETMFDLSELTDGGYVAFIQSNGQQSNAMKFIVKR